MGCSYTTFALARRRGYICAPSWRLSQLFCSDFRRRITVLPSVKIRENEHFDAALRRFKRACEKAGILSDLRRREYYEKPTQERKRKKAAAVKRQLKKSSREVTRRQRMY